MMTRSQRAYRCRKYICPSDPCEFCMAAGTDRLSAFDPGADPEYTFLEKHFKELRAFIPIPNVHKRYGTGRTQIKRLKFKYIGCICLLVQKNQAPPEITEFITNQRSSSCMLCPVMENRIPEEIKEPIPKQQRSTAQSGASTKSKYIVPQLEGHCNICNKIRLSKFFVTYIKYFTNEETRQDLLLLAYPPGSYKEKFRQEICKLLALKIRYRLQLLLEDWYPLMTDRNIVRMKRRNKFREYLAFMLSNMLEKVKGPNEDATEEEGSDNDDSISDDEKVKLEELKESYKNWQIHIEKKLKEKREFSERAFLNGIEYTHILAEFNDYSSFYESETDDSDNDL